MSASITTNVSDLYAVVDMSKKKAKQPTKGNAKNCSSVTSEYDVLERDFPLPKMGTNVKEQSFKTMMKDSPSYIRTFFAQNMKKCISIFTILVIFLCLILVIVLFHVKLSSLEEEMFVLHKISNTTLKNHSNSLNSLKKLVNEVQSNLAPINDYFLSSCLEIAKFNFLISGRYIVRSPSGVLISAYCDFNRTLGGNSTGWMRVAKLGADNCPVGFSRIIFKNMSLACSVSQDNAMCHEISVPVYKMRYTQITGRVQGYQKGSLDCFNEIIESGVRRPSSNSDISSNYLDGVSITSNGEHVWSFAAGCKCNNIPNKPNFVGDHFSADGLTAISNDMFNTNLLWKFQKCNTMSNWFHRILPSTNSDITIQVCQDQSLDDEEIAIAEIEIYIQ